MWVFWVNILVDILLSITFVLAIAHYGTHGWGNDGTEVGIYLPMSCYLMSVAGGNCGLSGAGIADVRSAAQGNTPVLPCQLVCSLV